MPLNIGITRVDGHYDEMINYMSPHSAMKLTHLTRTGTGLFNVYRNATEVEYTYDIAAAGNTVILSASHAANIIPASVRLTVNGTSVTASYTASNRHLTVDSDDGWVAGDVLVLTVHKSSDLISIIPDKDHISFGINNDDYLVVDAGVNATIEYYDMQDNEVSRRYYRINN